MKNVIFIILFLFSFLNIVHAQESQYEVDVETTLNARAEPNSNAQVLFTIPNGTVVVPTSVENGWAKVTVDGQTGYISTKFIRQIDNKGNESNKVEEPWSFRKWFESIVSLKFCYILIIILLIVNWVFTVAVPRNEYLEARCWSFIAMLCIMLLTYFGQDMKDLVNHYWTGGWLDGYFLAFLNSIVLSASVVQLYNSFVGCSCAAAKKAIEGTDVKFRQLSIDFYFWFFPLAVLCFLAVMLCADYLSNPWDTIVSAVIILTLIYFLIKKTIVNYKLMWPHYWIATFIPLAGFATLICIILMIYVSIVMLLLGIVVCAFFMGALRAAPEAIGKAMTAETTPEEDEKRIHEEQSQVGHIAFDEPYIIDGNGERKRITKVDGDDIHTDDGGIWYDGIAGARKIH